MIQKEITIVKTKDKFFMNEWSSNITQQDIKEDSLIKWKI